MKIYALLQNISNKITEENVLVRSAFGDWGWVKEGGYILVAEFVTVAQVLP